MAQGLGTNDVPIFGRIDATPTDDLRNRAELRGIRFDRLKLIIRSLCRDIDVHDQFREWLLDMFLQGYAAPIEVNGNADVHSVDFIVHVMSDTLCNDIGAADEGSDQGLFGRQALVGAASRFRFIDQTLDVSHLHPRYARGFRREL